jgi:hypothetical protein
MLRGILFGLAAVLAIISLVAKDYLKESALKIALAIRVGVLVASAVFVSG